MRQEDGLIPPIALQPRGAEPLYTQLYRGLREAIAAGRIAPGARLPSTRALARDMDVSRNTTIEAFRQLEEEGYVTSAVGSGTYVADDLPESLVSAPEPGAPATDVPATPRTLSSRGWRLVSGRRDLATRQGTMPFLPGLPALDEFPYEVWRRIERDVRIPRRELGRGDPAGHERLRQAIVDHLSATRAIRCTPSQVVITTGAQEVLTILADLLLDPEDDVLIEDPGYWNIARTLDKAGVRVVPVPVDDAGMDVGTGIARARDARLAHVTPSNQFPMGALLSMERRRALVRWAREAGSWIIEDDYDCEFRFHGPPYPAIRSLDGADVCTIYVNTFSKILFPALALGFVVLPDPLVEPFSLARAQRVYPPAIPPQLTLARFLEEGHFLRHIRRMRQVYLKRGETLENDLAEALPGQVRVSRPGAGAHLIAWLRPGENDRAVAERAASAGVIAPPLSRFRHVASERGALVLGFGGSPVTQIHDAVGKLRSAFR